MIPRQVAAAFPSGVRTRGDQYFGSGRVRVVQSDPAMIMAIVAGSTSYMVQVTAAQGILTVSCSCPYAAEHGICKHIWATLRFADTGRELDALVRTSGRNPNFVATSAEDALPLDELDEMVSQAAYDDLWLTDEHDAIAPTAEWSPPQRSLTPPRASTPQARAARIPTWKLALDRASRAMAMPGLGREEPVVEWPADRRLIYIIDLAPPQSASGLVVELATERLLRDGTWEPPTHFRFATATWQSIPDENDRRIAQMLIGAAANPFAQLRHGPFVLDERAIDTTLRAICETGRCRVRYEPGERPVDPVGFDDGPPWLLKLRVERTRTGGLRVMAVLQREREEMPLSEPKLLHAVGVLLARGKFSRFDSRGAFSLVALFREQPMLEVDESDLAALLERLYTLPHRPEIELPADAHVTEWRSPPQAGIVIHPDPSSWRKTHHRLERFFIYGPLRLTGAEPDMSVYDRASRSVYHRDLVYERTALERLFAAGAKEEWHYAELGKCLVVHANKLMRMIAELVNAGWRVEAEGMEYRAAGEARASVRSGIDWFELSGGVRYGDIEVSLPELLAAKKSGATTIELSDGSKGLIPADLLARLAPLSAGTAAANGTLRFARSQTALLDALLSILPEAKIDEAFENARNELQAFERVAPADPPASFRGALREYQREGLGWLHFLRRFGLGGCLADDMGLGKTIQILALLESRRVARIETGSPRQVSIVVVPRSLVFNWLREAERFAPGLRMLDFTGVDRRVEDVDVAHTDVVLTTYGTLRRDVARLAGIEFDYAILDEAQAIKTGGSASAKAARLLRADHRVAMTGTPIENRLEELWSIFEFLNPGMLGASTTFAALAKASRADAGDASGRAILSRALRPVILRRTKGQVATELPARVEQTLHVELEGAQRKFYDGLLESYRQSVFERIDRLGLGKARMHILEALLRLRQAACHPALVDARKKNGPSAKLDALLPALDEVRAEGHKALVFSQFTSFLDLVRERLDEGGTTYEYLDGKTRDRQAHVDRFQSDDACSLFLISLKAGGHGLNLTAADYVFILDPWWNPAVEAQAIDRSHRIGQTRRVVATRIVARDTIEEKILELQASKRALADAILGQDQGVLSEIGRAELEMLLT